MATFNLTITYPDGEQARIMAALKAAAETVGTPAPTNAQAIEWLRGKVVGIVKTTVRDMETRAATNAVTDVGAV